jgi:hypothetical protein
MLAHAIDLLPKATTPHNSPPDWEPSNEEPSDAEEENSLSKAQLIADLAKAQGQVAELNSELETTQTTLAEVEERLNGCIKQRTEQDSTSARVVWVVSSSVFSSATWPWAFARSAIS